MRTNNSAALQSGTTTIIEQHTKNVSEPSISYWRNHAMSLIKNGYDVIPLRPRAKIPLGNSWAKKVALAQADTGRYPDDCGIGVRTKNMPAIDVDTTDRGLGDRLRRAALKIIGEDGQVLYRFGHRPKFLIPCRLGGEPFKKLASQKFIKPDDMQSKPTIHRLEILGDGQQFVAFGIHPDTAEPYVWSRRQCVTEYRLDELPELDHAMATRIVAEFERLALEAGYIVYSNSAASPSERKDDSAIVDDSDYLAALGVTFQEDDEDTQAQDLTSAIEFIKSHSSDPIADYDFWISVGQGLAGSKGTSLEDGCEALWQSISYYEDEAHSKWQGFKPNSTGIKAVYAKAARLGWKNPAKSRTIINGASQDEKLEVSLGRHEHWSGVIEEGSVDDLKTLRALMSDISQDPDLGATERNLLADPIKKYAKATLGLALPVSDIRKDIKYKDARSTEMVVIDLEPDPYHGKPKNTIENFELVLAHFGVEVRYNKMTKRDEITLPYSDGAPDTEDQAKVARVTSLLEQVSMPASHTNKYLSAVANTNAYNPAEDYLLSGTWDGEDRICQFCDELVTPLNFDEKNKRTFIERWLLSCVGAVLTDDGRTDERQFRYVLTLQGGESIGKTTWLLNLVPPATRRKISGIVKTGLNIDPKDPNSVKEAIGCWIGEVGELDATLNKTELGRLKSFLSNNMDRPRRLYVNDSSPTPRRTVWCASVNGLHFLDDSDNTRFMVIPLVSIARDRPTDRDQLWFQIVDMFKNGEVGDLTKAEQKALIESNRTFRKPSVVRDAILETFDWSEQDKTKWCSRGLREILKLADFSGLESRKYDAEARRVLEDLCGTTNITMSKGLRRYKTPPVSGNEDFDD